MSNQAQSHHTFFHSQVFNFLGVVHESPQNVIEGREAAFKEQKHEMSHSSQFVSKSSTIAGNGTGKSNIGEISLKLLLFKI